MMHHRLLNWPWNLMNELVFVVESKLHNGCMWCDTAQSVLALNISSEGR